MSAAHHHGHSHSHRHGPGASDRHARDARAQRALSTTLALVVCYMVVELVGGIYSNSLALLADAGHMLSDAGALGLAIFASWFSRRPASARHTYGYYRAEILEALVNAATLIVIAVFIFLEAYQRLWSPPAVHGGVMLGVAAGGLLVNLFGLWALHDGRHDSLNAHGAWLHVATDALGSAQAIVAAVMILLFGWYWLDPVVSFAIGLLVIYAAWALMRESVAVLMESAPGSIDVDEVRACLMRVTGVQDVHDLHVWTIASGLVALSAHVSAERPASNVLRDLRHELEERFGIRHSTIQFDPPGEDRHTIEICASAGDSRTASAAARR
jgi:cobalt-zinc-cadmium efflux system protein